VNMPTLRKLDYFYLRYSPRATMDDYVTLGVVMLEPSPGGFAGVRFSRNYRRVICSHPDADLDYFRSLEQEIRQRLAVVDNRGQFVNQLYDLLGNSLQLSPHKELLTEDPQAAMELLAQTAIDPPQPSAKSSPSGQRRILQKMQYAFEQAGVWELLRKSVPAAQYTSPGDPFKIDFAYRPNGVVKMLQAMSLQSSIEPAIKCAFSYPLLVEGIAGKEHAETQMTAILEDDLERTDPHIAFALSHLEKVGVDLAIAAELPGIANQIRQEISELST